MDKFKVGDRIRMIETHDYAEKGMVGTIMGEKDSIGSYAVKFDNKFDGGHDLDGKCADGYGHWIIPEAMELLHNTFRVGDRVRIRSWESMEKEFGTDCSGNILTHFHFIDHMKPLCGRTATISSIKGKEVNLRGWSNTNGDIAWSYSTDMLEPAEERYGHLYSESQEVCGKIGTPTKMHDCNGKKLFVGDVVESFCREGNSYGECFVAEDCDSQFVAGIKCECRKDGKIEDGWYVKKKRSYTEILDGEKLKGLTFRIESNPKFEVGQVYLVNSNPDKGTIVKITSASGDSLGVKVIRGNTYLCGFKVCSETTYFLTLLTGKEIGEAIRKWDADHAKKEPKYKEVKRHAKAGEFIKIVHPMDNITQNYSKGDVLLVLEELNSFSVICKGILGCVVDLEYVVLEGYKPEKKGKHTYTEEQINEAKKIVLKMIQEFYSKSKGSILFSTNAINPEEGNAYVLEKDISVLKSSRKGEITSVTAEQVSHGISKCSNNDESNEWIGKCVALCKALHKPIPQFIMDGD